MGFRKQVKRFTSWSYSRLSDYLLCPLKSRLKHLDKLQEPKNEAMARGGEIHLLAEQFIRGQLKKLPVELALFKALFTELRKRYRLQPTTIVVEESWAFTKDWVRCKWDDWDICWVRIKLDCGWFEDDGETLIIADWKTGKFRETEVHAYAEQLELYALAGLILYPDVLRVKPRLVYTDTSIVFTGSPELVFTQADVPALKKKWGKKVLPMFNDTTFAPRPNQLCKWCWFGQAAKVKGGPGVCRY
jgi:hypothetical protein